MLTCMQGSMCCRIYILERQGLSRFQGYAGKKSGVVWDLVYYVVGGRGGGNEEGYLSKPLDHSLAELSSFWQR